MSSLAGLCWGIIIAVVGGHIGLSLLQQLLVLAAAVFLFCAATRP